MSAWYHTIWYDILKVQQLQQLQKYNTDQILNILIGGSMQDCSISMANALEILQSYTKP